MEFEIKPLSEPPKDISDRSVLGWYINECGNGWDLLHVQDAWNSDGSINHQFNHFNGSVTHWTELPGEPK